MARVASPSAKELLQSAEALLTARPQLLELAQRSWRGGFSSGALWMQAALVLLGSPARPSRPQRMYQIAGFGKYGAAAFAASTPLLLVLSTSTAWAFAFYPLALVAALILFYAVEAQFVFLFPLLLEHKPRPIAASILLTRSVGGTLATMRRILPIAAHMLFGGLLGKGFLRSWLRGCLAVLIWYRQVYDPTRA